MQFGAAEDVVRSPDLPSAKAKMTLLRLAGFASVRVTSQWQGTEAAPSETELTILRNVVGAAQLSAVKVYLSVYPNGLERDAADARGARAVRRLPDRPQAAAALGQGRDRRQRAEHQPLLAAAVHAHRHRRRGACLPRPARALLRRDQGRRPGDTRLGRRARTTRDRPARHRPRHALARRVPQGHGRRLPRERPHGCRSWTGSPSIPTPTPRASRPTRRTRTRPRSASPTTTG